MNALVVERVSASKRLQQLAVGRAQRHPRNLMKKVTDPEGGRSERTLRSCVCDSYLASTGLGHGRMSEHAIYS